MELQAFVGLVRRRWPVVVLAFVVCVVMSAVISQAKPKVYTTSARLYVNVPGLSNPSQAAQAVELTSNLLASYARIVDSQITTSRVSKAFDNRLTTEVVRSKVSAAPVPQTLLIDVRAADGNPALATELANATATALASVIDELGADAGGVKAEIVDQAIVPTRATSPQPQRDVLIGAFFGLALGAGIALAMDSLDKTIRESSVAAEVFDAPVLCSIPKQRRIAADPLVALKAGGSATGEAYRALRTAIRFRETSRKLKTVLVTSAAAGDGKSTISANLAIAMSLDGARTILIDADLRRTRLGDMFNIPAGPGLTDVLLGKAKLADALVQWSPGLAVLQVGSQSLNPSEALGSQAMVSVLEQARQLADIVVVDAPPVLPVSDPAVLAALCDGTVLVCRWQRTSLHAAAATRRMLENVGADVIGVVLNAEGGGRSSNYYRHYSTRAPRRRPEAGGSVTSPNGN